MTKIEEVGIRLWGEQRKCRLEARFVAYVPGGYCSQPQPHKEILSQKGRGSRKKTPQSS